MAKSIHTCSIIFSPEPIHAFLASRFCLSIDKLKLSISTSISISLTASWVRSIGKPYVSYNLKATSPENFSPLFNLFISLSNSFKPLSKVDLNLISSFSKLSSINCFASINSGNAAPISRVKDATILYSIGSLTPKK